MVTPTIHMNGTAPDDLLEDAARAASAVSKAIEACQKAGPNARDYYPQGGAAWATAREEHLSRLTRLASVMEEYSVMAEKLADEIAERSERRKGRYEGIDRSAK
jgi:hypothetical protein